MKYIYPVLFLLLFTQCKEEIKPIGEPFSQLEGINDTWQLISIEQTDELDKGDANPLDVSAIMMGSQPARITFNSSDFTYSLAPGTMRNFFPTSGSWFFDDNDYPAAVTLENTGEQFELKLQAPIRRESGEDELIIKYIRPIGNCVELENGLTGAVAYQYTFLRE